jgi:uncharacterized membrane protein
MTISEIIATIFAVVILAKTVLIFRLKPKQIMGFADKMYSKPVYINLGFLASILILGALLLIEMPIAHIMAASVFGIMVYAFVLVQYPSQLLKTFRTVLNDKSKMWLPLLVYLVLAIWVLTAIFG